jgi:DNA-binding IclR family transcriptional regulator
MSLFLKRFLMRADYQVPMVLKTLRIVETLEDRGDELTLTSIARRSRVAKASAFRILETLHSAGYVEKDPASGHYRMGIKILELGQAVQKNDELRSLGMPCLLALRRQFNESTNLAVLENGEVVYLATVESSSMLRIARGERSRSPIHCTALGKVLAAFTPWETVRAILRAKGMAKRTLHTIVSWNEFKREVEKTRRKGLAYDEEEFEIGGWCVAAPVFDYTGAMVCALSIAAPLTRARGREREMGLAIKAAAAQFSAKLGYQAEGPRRLSSSAALESSWRSPKYRRGQCPRDR